MNEIPSDNCVRIRKRIEGENVYFLVGDGFLIIKFPYENRVEFSPLKTQIYYLCEAISRMMEGT